MEFINIMHYNSPIGQLKIGSIGQELCLCDWTMSKRHAANCERIRKELNAVLSEGDSETVKEAILQLDEYFAGERMELTVPLRICGTEFQRLVWHELRNIKYGEVISYRDLGQRLGKPTAVRAVAAMVAANPISIFLPCHRVIGIDGRLTGYAGGLEAKSYLLSNELRNFCIPFSDN